MAWQTSALQRFEFSDGHPSLERMMGLPESAPDGDAMMRKMDAGMGFHNAIVANQEKL
tara:strand:+ start:1059 stop:1232 length:174 start_codon:yes stop_codon:yes gene_type:complete